jgi:hypothetical protein
MRFVTTILGDLHLFLSLVSKNRGEPAEALRAAADLVLRRKAIAAEALAAQRDAVRGGRYPALQAQLRRLADLRMQIARKTLAGPGPEGWQTHRQQLEQWDSQKERLEADLSRQIPEMNLDQKLRQVDRRAVALALDQGVSLIEFIRFIVYDFHATAERVSYTEWKPPQRGQQARYLAFVLRGGEPDDVEMIDLGEAGPIDRLIADFRATVSIPPEERSDSERGLRRSESVLPPDGHPGLRLRAALFDALIPTLGDRRRLLLSPDGALAWLPFEVLPTDDGGRLIDRYQISYLGCGRDVLRFGAVSSGQPADPLVIADPDFDLGAETSRGGGPSTVKGGQPATSRPRRGFWSRLFGRRDAVPPSEPRPVATAAPFHARHSRDFNRSQHRFARLPGSREEGERIAGLLQKQPWLGAAALEGRLKQECRSPYVLHLATHGFFLRDQHYDLNRMSRGLELVAWEASPASGRLSGPEMENPLLRSGLALAGANTWLQNGALPPEAEDGLLTAEDVSGLDLLSTELVVLSACETGLGTVQIGEGVLGLRRAFVLAGAKTLIMSLWKVPDRQTQELMEEFYRRILAGQSRADALREAQLSLKSRYPDPFYWGAFICQGDPAPLGLEFTSPVQRP